MILEFHPRDDHMFVIQAWVWGHDLARKLEHAAKYPASWPHPAECFQIYRRLAHGLTQIHRETGLVHGDIKPSNIVLVGNRVFLIDFGNAWTLEQSAHRPPGDGLSARYSSPEQHRADAFVEFSSDYFSASVIAYQMFSRQTAVWGLGWKARLSRIRKREHRQTHSGVPALSVPVIDARMNSGNASTGSSPKDLR